MLSKLAQTKWRWGVLGLALVLVAAAVGAVALTRSEQAAADQEPPGCNTNGLTETLSVTPSGVVRDGATLVYSVTFTNSAAGACNVTGLTASLVKPDGSSTALLSNLTFNAGDPSITCPGDARCATAGPYQYTVNHANEVGSASGCPPTTTPPPPIGSGPRLVVAYAHASGTLHISSVDFPDSAMDCKVVQNVVTHPHTTLTKTASPTSGRAPLSVTYTYNETNDGDSPISGVSLSDDQCSPVAFQSGDTNSNGILDPGETWIYTCSKTYNSPGTFTNHVTATGTATTDSQPAPEERAQATVTVTQPAVGRMTGGGSVFRIDGARVTRGFEIHCDLREPNNIEVNWPGGNNFHMTSLTAAVCTDDPAIIQAPPVAPFDTFTGDGTGKLNGEPGATIHFVFVDAGEPGKNDTALIQIWDSASNLVLEVSGFIDVGNLQAHKD